MNEANENRRDGNKEQIGFSNNRAGYESPPEPPSFNIIIKLIFKNSLFYQGGGKYILFKKAVSPR
jgi:hypothetical protein